MVFSRLKIRSKTANMAEVNEEKLREVSRHFGSLPRQQSDLGTFLVSIPEGNFESGHHDDHPHLDQERDSNESWVPTCLAPIAQVHPSVTEPRKNENLATEYNESPLYDDVAAYQGTSHGRNESSVYENVAVYQVASHGRNESPVYDNVAVYQCTSQERNESPVYDNVAVYIINESPVNDYLEYY
ncbi:hypothetical protein E2C01_002257 [Portunus trituberculatus]|uniref:Uncharacterized protein n=1 Tax=Portunus trituberculatus TaxID=210409 RepID=A0A5B7CLH2_PORTR|nr:hypothetical protein [Portunus trituberculatus]